MIGELLVALVAFAGDEDNIAGLGERDGGAARNCRNGRRSGIAPAGFDVGSAKFQLN